MITGILTIIFCIATFVMIAMPVLGAIPLSENASTILDGLEKKNGSIAPVLDKSSHNPTNAKNRKICQNITINLSFLSLLRYFACAFE